MNYKSFPPSPALDAFVKCHWTLEGPREAHPARQRIVPDGCMEMIFHHGDRYRQHLKDGSSIVQPRCFVFGQITAALDIEPTGETGIFAVRFHPEGFTAFTTLPPSAMNDRAVPLEELFGEEGSKLEKDVLAASTTAERIRISEAFLADRLRSPEAIDRIVQASVELILDLNGRLSVEELSQQMRVHRRQLERRFSTVIGLSPKQLSKIVRLQRTLKRLLSGESTSLTAAAHEGDYYDQAHFIKDFREFTGHTPKRFYSDNLKMSALFHGTE